MALKIYNAKTTSPWITGGFEKASEYTGTKQVAFKPNNEALSIDFKPLGNWYSTFD